MYMNLIKGDCIEELKDISDNSVDCFICDLPYGTTALKWDIKIDLEELWIEMKRTARNDNTPYFFFCDMRLAVELINSNPKMFRYDLVWYKPNSSCRHLNSGKMPMKNHELLLVFYKKLPTYNKKKYHNKLKNANIIKEEGGIKDKVYGATYTENNYHLGGSIYDTPLPQSILTFNIENKMSHKNRFHPTQKPQGILEWIIKYYTNEGDTVLDPTMGSGSTGVACVSLNRKFIGIERNEDYFNVASTRITK
jgi:site-specific DNA-methyltransferase (adenine-specific)